MRRYGYDELEDDSYGAALASDSGESGALLGEPDGNGPFVLGFGRGAGESIGAV